jgi:hypothetical protein
LVCENPIESIRRSRNGDLIPVSSAIPISLARRRP